MFLTLRSRSASKFGWLFTVSLPTNQEQTEIEVKVEIMKIMTISSEIHSLVEISKNSLNYLKTEMRDCFSKIDQDWLINWRSLLLIGPISYTEFLEEHVY